MTVNRRELITGASALVAGATAIGPAAAAGSNAKPASRPAAGHADRCYSDDYQIARGRFIEAASAVGARLEHHKLPGHKGPDGKDLFMDAAWIGPADADVVVVSVCGTHGAEGFGGSAAQIDWLLTEAPRRNLPKGVAALLVHAVNPFGFAHLLRINENGVNINRNSVDFSKPVPQSPLFEQIYKSFPTRMGYDEDLIAEFNEAYVAAEKQFGKWEVSDALGRGQYTLVDAPEYGGKRSEWSSQTLFAILKKNCSRARHVAYIDWHTLIKIGDGQLVFLCFNQTRDPLFNRVGSWWGMENIDREAVNKQWSTGTSNKRPSRSGILMWGVQHALAPKIDVAGAVIEFCADSDKLLHKADRDQRWWVYTRWMRQMRDYTSPTGRFVAACLREVCCPTRLSFKEAALTIARDTYARTFEGAARWAQENVAAQPGKLIHYAAFE
ncbi:MAG TPA: DUF2817 domain-containing protein [Steroidobacteraceae bacterium]|nr:DUF2817 domain-containing protein [Steroidobacteraceae bacterium]